MDEKILQVAIDIMDNLMTHPITSYFIDPLEPGDSAIEPQYFEIIKNPIDLTTIKDRLVKKQYQNPQNWLSDVDLVWSNAHTYYGPDSHFGIVSDDCRRIFQKECRKLDRFSLGTWCSEVTQIKTKIYELLSAPPQKVKQYTPSSNVSRGSKHNMPLLSERELQDFVKASSYFTSEEDNAAIFQIIEENEPSYVHQKVENEEEEDENQEKGKLEKSDDGDAEQEKLKETKNKSKDGEEVIFDITKLPLQTIYKLRDYFRASFEKAGKEYPGA